MGDEARLFAIAIPAIIDEYNEDVWLDAMLSGNASAAEDIMGEKNNDSRLRRFGGTLMDYMFEELSPAEQFTVLEDVAIGLLTATPSVPDMYTTIVSVYTTASVFSNPARGPTVFTGVVAS
jgi:hypothetical protein